MDVLSDRNDLCRREIDCREMISSSQHVLPWGIYVPAGAIIRDRGTRCSTSLRRLPMLLAQVLIDASIT